jgi:hypothetical protein
MRRRTGRDVELRTWKTRKWAGELCFIECVLVLSLFVDNIDLMPLYLFLTVIELALSTARAYPWKSLPLASREGDAP